MSKSLRSLVAVICCIALAGLVVGQDTRPKPKDDEKAAPRPRFDAERFIKDFDKNGDGKLSKDEVPPDLRERFDELDLNKDGFLDKDELTKHAARIVRRPSPVELLQIFIDTAPDDAASRDELQRAYDLLRKIDANGDGKIDEKELAAARESYCKECVEGMLKEFDKNKDGKISREEARGMPAEEFDRLDANKDGFIDRDELIRAFTRVKPKAGETKEKPAREREK